MSDRLREVAEDLRPSDVLEERCSELGNARRLVRLAGQDLRYVHPWTRWLVWDGARWAADCTGEVERRAKLVVESLDIEVAAEHDEARRKDLRRHALTSQGARAIRNMIALAQSERAVAVPPEAFDRDRPGLPHGGGEGASQTLYAGCADRGDRRAAAGRSLERRSWMGRGPAHSQGGISEARKSRLSVAPRLRGASDRIPAVSALAGLPVPRSARRASRQRHLGSQSAGVG